MQDSRKIGFNFACPLLREYTIKWVQDNAHAIYQPLYYLKALESYSINLCRTDYSKYLTARKAHFENTSVATSSPLKLLPGTTEYNLNEQKRKVLNYPPNILQYLRGKRPASDKKRLNRINNRCRFHLISLDTCNILHYDQQTISKHPTVSTTKQDAIPDERRKRQKTSTSSNNNSEIYSTSQNPETTDGSKDSEQGNVVDSSTSNSTAINGDYISFSIWNAPSLSHWELTKSNSQIDDTVQRLSHLPQFVAADCLIKTKIIQDRNRDLRSAIITFIQYDYNAPLPDNFGVRCVKDWNLIIDLDADFSQFDTVVQNKHVDLYVGLLHTS